MMIDWAAPWRETIYLTRSQQRMLRNPWTDLDECIAPRFNWNEDWDVQGYRSFGTGVTSVQFVPARKKKPGHSQDLPCDVEPILELA
jgi:hypothetical protein